MLGLGLMVMVIFFGAELKTKVGLLAITVAFIAKLDYTIFERRFS